MTSVDARVVLVTAPNETVARSLVRQLVEERVVACGTIVPGVASIYRWDGDIQEDTEALVVFKATAGAMERLLSRVPELHPYDVPEVLALPVEAGHVPYLQWLVESTEA